MDLNLFQIIAVRLIFVENHDQSTNDQNSKKDQPDIMATIQVAFRRHRSLIEYELPTGVAFDESSAEVEICRTARHACKSPHHSIRLSEKVTNIPPSSFFSKSPSPDPRRASLMLLHPSQPV